MNRDRLSVLAPALMLAATVLAGCAQYVTREEFDSTVGDLRATDGELASEIQGMNQLFSELSGDLGNKFGDYDAQIAEIQGRLRVDMTAHFGFGEYRLRPEDIPVLDHFIGVVRSHQEAVVVTVEGFTDPAGDPEYNKWLGLQRAKSVADYLVNVGGLPQDHVRAVSYGEDSERQIKQNAWGANGAANRRVALVIDYVPR